MVGNSSYYQRMRVHNNITQFRDDWKTALPAYHFNSVLTSPSQLQALFTYGGFIIPEQYIANQSTPEYPQQPPQQLPPVIPPNSFNVWIAIGPSLGVIAIGLTVGFAMFKKKKRLNSA